MKDEIIGGLRNALERGSSPDVAVQSFINAGYNPIEVKQAAQFILQKSGGLAAQMLDKDSSPATLTNLGSSKESRMKQGNVIILISILIVLIIFFISLIFLRDKIPDIFKALFSK